MPRYRTPHHTDGSGIGRKLRGSKLLSRLAELADVANSHHRDVGTRNSDMLEHARQAGEALLEAQRRLGRRSKWSKWRRRNFHASKETSCHYMRIAREWNDPRIQEARTSGVSIDSIAKFLGVLRGQPLKNNNGVQPDGDDAPSERLLRPLRRSFGQFLRTLNSREVEVLHDIACGSDGDHRWLKHIRREFQSIVRKRLKKAKEEEAVDSELAETPGHFRGRRRRRGRRDYS